MHPTFPRLKANVTPKGHYPKDPLATLMNHYDRLSALGLYVLPKKPKEKFPLYRYWRKDDPVICNRGLALADQKNDEASGWCIATGERSGRLYVLDLDTSEIERYGVDPYTLYEWVQAISESGFVLASPSGGVHIYYRIPPEFEMIGNDAPPVQGVDGRGEGGQVVSLSGYNRYDNLPTDNKADKKGVPDGHTASYTFLDDGEYSTIPYMTIDLYDWIMSDKVKKRNSIENEAAERYSRTEQGQARLEAHRLQATTEQERIVIECLEFVLPTWESGKKDYNTDWLPMWMSANIGSGGSSRVRDFILTHPAISWRGGEKGRQQFRHAWDTFIPREDGITVTTLFYMAKAAGWLTRTGYEISDHLTEKINVQFVTDWLETLEEIPELAAIISQTGSGKTTAIEKVFNRLGCPKTVIFVPSIKLATELANTLRNKHGLPAVLYYDADKGRSIPQERLIEAPVLVTTLQTFVSRVYEAGVPMSAYGLVVFEECDQLFGQFAKGGGGLYGSHVSEREARLGFQAIREAYAKCKHVWGMDATMSRITYDTIEAVRGIRSNRVIKNIYTSPKAPVKILESQDEAYQEILKSLERGERVVVATDTAQVAEEVEEAMRAVGVLDGKTAIVITRHTERRKAVREFMEDVNAGALAYDLVCYNSSMASGVSITSVKPDLIVQICTYLTPRVNLQILNRYRQQSRVLVYYRKGENIYARRAHDILTEAERRAYIESRMVNIPLAVRTKDAELRSHLTAIYEGDREQQERSAREFYSNLLREDGREVAASENVVVASVIANAREAVKAIRKERISELKHTWPETPPIDQSQPALPNYTPLQIAQGEIHAQITRALKGHTPEGVPPEQVYNIVYEFMPHIGALSAFVDQEKALERSERKLADRSKALTALTNHISLVRLAATLHHLYHDLEERIDTATLKERAPKFMAALIEARDAYDVVIERNRQAYDEVVRRSPTEEKQAVAFAKILLSRLGLKQRAVQEGRGNTCYEITNAAAAKLFLKWRGSVLTFTDAPVRAVTEGRASYIEIFKAMSEEQQNAVQDLIENEKFTDFKTAVLHVNAGPEKW